MANFYRCLIVVVDGNNGTTIINIVVGSFPVILAKSEFNEMILIATIDVVLGLT